MRKFFEVLKRAMIALILLALGCGGGTIIAQILFEICARTLGMPWWVGANGWFVNTIARPWGVLLGLASFLNYRMYLSFRDEAAAFHLSALALVNNQQKADLPGAQPVPKPAGSMQELVLTERSVVDERA